MRLLIIAGCDYEHVSDKMFVRRATTNVIRNIFLLFIPYITALIA